MKAQIKPRIDLENRTKLEEVIPLKTPFVIFVDPADTCNFRCKFCPTGDRGLMKKTHGRNFGIMDFNLYKKIINDICEFEEPIKVLRLYKEGEPLLNPNFVDMVKYAKDKGCALKIDTTTNASLLNPKKNIDVIEAGLDRINISIEGINDKLYKDFTGISVNFKKIVENIRHFYENKGKCEMCIKINGDILSQDERDQFYEIFGNITDKIFVEHIAPCWPEFELNGVEVNNEYNIYNQKIKEVIVCPYVFYSFAVNSDGTVSLCFLDWSRKLLIGDTKLNSVKEIWNSNKLIEYQKFFLTKKRKNHPICGNCGQLTHCMPDDIDMYAEKILDTFFNKK